MNNQYSPALFGVQGVLKCDRSTQLEAVHFDNISKVQGYEETYESILFKRKNFVEGLRIGYL